MKVPAFKTYYVLCALFFGFCLLSGCQEQNTYVEPPPPKVTVAQPLEKDVTGGRSTKGPASKNDVPVVLWKESQESGKKRKKKNKKP